MGIDWFNGVNETWGYVLVFLLAAAPWLEVFLVVPLGILAGLSPVPVALLGFAGNFIPIALIAIWFKKWTEWRAKRKGMTEEEQMNSRKRSRAKKVWDRYGMPGLALLAPAIVGTDIAAILALSFGSPRKSVLIWMTASLAIWTILLAYGTVYGLSFVEYFRR
ncbi:Predicted membrane protein [Chlamydia abortus]|uniref:small multi-drug export protein n=1 Tax=unclassified Paenibacillus TaxID=185978 RepID=UPI000A27C7CB|nr:MULTISPECIES: small multi-drug export protein [Paenibacillaceae]SHE12461.1 Predicted membrane protein [Chlamydia abortus]